MKTIDCIAPILGIVIVLFLFRQMTPRSSGSSRTAGYFTAQVDGDRVIVTTSKRPFGYEGREAFLIPGGIDHMTYETTVDGYRIEVVPPEGVPPADVAAALRAHNAPRLKGNRYTGKNARTIRDYSERYYE